MPIDLPGAPLEVVVDCDPGVDDALALLAMAQLAAQGAVRVAHVTAVAGNAPVEVTSRNAAYVIARSWLRGTPVLAGPPRTAAAVAGEHQTDHGADGLGGLAPAGGSYLVQPAAVDALASQLAAGTVVLALGPLTNVAGALRIAELQVATGASVVVMGGRCEDRPGAPRPGAEFNFAFDPAAADAVLASEVPATVVPLDVTERVRFTGDDVRFVRHSATNTLVADLLGWSVSAHERAHGAPGSPVHDAVALIALVNPELTKTSRRAFSVCRDGEDAGRLRPRADARGAAQVVVDCDVARVRRRLLDLWAATP